jgi:hypothetical protein
MTIKESKNMQKNPHQIAEEIKRLVDQLVDSTKSIPPHTKITNRKSPAKSTEGATGALSVLIEEGFFDSPKGLSAVTVKLQEIGRHYPQPSVSMNLLNLTRRRTLIRIRDSKTKLWQYVVRR